MKEKVKSKNDFGMPSIYDEALVKLSVRTGLTAERFFGVRWEDRVLAVATPLCGG
jgi:hypothetical protein